MLQKVGQFFGCVNCKRSLVFRTEQANCVICTNCRALNYRLSIPEKEAPVTEKVKEEMSVIRVGTTGTFREIKFEVVGRYQYLFKDGYRNHWQIVFSDGRESWLGDWAGNYSIFQAHNNTVAETFANAVPGKKVEINKISFELEMLDEHRLTLAEGEVNDLVLGLKGFISLFFINPSGAMALVNIYPQKKADAPKGVYQTPRIEIFTGNYVEFSSLNLQNTRNYDDWR
ncbi:DUF4178 domain-containing protein [Adhaeribacter soli]|uniref:DUF4178 domain-containing protein n=1 Tax=Adhaeribacter soli TaxID=2607655 RepID=A0A5N1J429_9BACT|nr:DUF4178 domain-containing protein [Adhaeribacter soli]KAA9345661.1 DUF4178 domain-containing protein [Adhaeribacter soli]